MKLRNKETGEIGYLLVSKGSNYYIVTNDEWEDCGKYNSLAELNEEWEDAPEEPKEFWFIGEDSCVHSENDTVTQDFVDRLKSIGNYFETKEKAEQAIEKLKAWKRLKDKGFKFVGKTYETDTRFGSAFYQLNEDTYSEDVMADLDLSFRGEE